AARAAALMPTPPPAPARFSTTTGCFSTCPIASATGRATVSATPPGGNGTIIVIGWFGYSCAASGDAASSSRNASALARIVCLADQRRGKGARIERLQIVDPFAHPDEEDRNRTPGALARKCDQHPALRSAIEFCDDDAGDTDCRIECAGLHQRVLSVRSVKHQDHFVRRSRLRLFHCALDALQLIHQMELRWQPASGVGNEYIPPAGLGRRDRIEHHGCRIAALLRNHLDAIALAPDCQLLTRCGPKRISGREQNR